MNLKYLSFVFALILLSGCVQKEMPRPEEPGGWEPDGVIGDDEYFGSAILYGPESSGYSGGAMEVFWTIDDEYLYMALKGDTTGWVSIGFDPLEWKKYADVVIGYVDGDEVVVDDQHIIDIYGPHISDEDLGGNFDILEFGGLEREGQTVIEFKRRLDTGDEFDTVIKPDQDLSIVWSMSNSDDLQHKHDIARVEGRLLLGEEAGEAVASTALTSSERDGILLIWEEEMMAKDIYLKFYNMSKLSLFLNVAGTKQIHMNSVQILMEKYGMEKPVQEGDGVYTNETLQKIYDDLLASGGKSPEDALKAAALLEETSVRDLEKEISDTDKPDIKSVFGGLLVSSKKQLRTLERALEDWGVEYSPQILGQEEFDGIVKG